jgi:molecular chaperone Hsp33
MNNFLVTHSDYFPGREVLFLQLDMSNYLIDYYIHVGTHVGNLDPAHDEKLKQLIACFALHLTIHPPDESHAWTLHLHAEKPYSLFVTGSASGGFIVGHVLSDDIRHTDVNTFHAQVKRIHGESSRSSVQCEYSDVAKIVQHYYAQSEQLPIRIELSKDSDTALALAAMPAYQEKWFNRISLSKLATEDTSPRKHIKSCQFAFNCDCSPDKLLPFLRAIGEDGITELYGEDVELVVTCPRCGRAFVVARDDLEQRLN